MLQTLEYELEELGDYFPIQPVSTADLVAVLSQPAKPSDLPPPAGLPSGLPSGALKPYVSEIRRLIATGLWNDRQLAERYGCGVMAIRKLRKGRSYRLAQQSTC